MADCGVTKECPFFNDGLPAMPVVAMFFKELYCRGNPDICARWIIFRELGADAVPADLFPNQEARAWQIVSRSRGQS